MDVNKLSYMQPHTRVWSSVLTGERQDQDYWEWILERCMACSGYFNLSEEADRDENYCEYCLQTFIAGVGSIPVAQHWLSYSLASNSGIGMRIRNATLTDIGRTPWHLKG